MKKRFSLMMLIAASSVLFWAAFLAEDVSGQSSDAAVWEEIKRSTHSALLLEVELASENPPEETEQRNKAFDLLFDQAWWAEAERSLAVGMFEVEYTPALDMFEAPPANRLDALVVAPGELPTHQIWAMRWSYARFIDAEDAEHRDWMAKHLSASQKYAGLAAQGLLAQAKTDEENLAKLQSTSFAVRRPLDRAEAFIDNLKRDGLSAEHRKLLLESGYKENELDGYLKELLATPPDKVGISMVELYTDIVKFRRTLASVLQEYAEAKVLAPAGGLSNSYIVGNPHDKAETVDLYIRPVSIPPGWKLSIVNVQEDAAGQGATPTPDKSKPIVQEVEPGKHYRVRLPAGAEIKVASIVIPVGEVGANTTARWAVEGKIGDELIGGMMHEMSVPYVIPDLQLPPVGSAQETAPGGSSTATQPTQANWLLYGGVAAVGLIVLAALLFVLMRRRGKVTGS